MNGSFDVLKNMFTSDRSREIKASDLEAKEQAVQTLRRLALGTPATLPVSTDTSDRKGCLPTHSLSFHEALPPARRGRSRGPVRGTTRRRRHVGESTSRSKRGFLQLQLTSTLQCSTDSKGAYDFYAAGNCSNDKTALPFVPDETCAPNSDGTSLMFTCSQNSVAQYSNDRCAGNPSVALSFQCQVAQGIAFGFECVDFPSESATPPNTRHATFQH